MMSKEGEETSSCAVDDPLCTRLLFWGSGSPPAWRARLCLEEKRIPYRSKLISFEEGDLKTPEMLALNPRGMVPIFVDGDIVMYESLAIVTYLETVENESVVSLMPKQRRLAAKALVRMHEANNASAHVGEVVYYLRRTKPEDVNETYLNSKREAMYSEISLWERYFDSGDEFLAGSSISVADVSFFPTLAYIVRLGFDLSRFPRLNMYYIRMCKRPAVQASWPPHWKETEGSKPLRGL
mmetsp:Transcript_23308/g.28720  ORF Transcript_23308/g.28720 Transcript_23308/m.28720 type:complete len:239 (+) Transcript_23308:64-780(+)